MSKNEYLKAMSGVRPSEETIERIMDMTYTKKRRFSKGLIGVLVALAILVCGGVTANAATDGAVGKAFRDGLTSLEFVINGETQSYDDLTVRHKERKDADGNIVHDYVVETKDGDKFSFGGLKDGDAKFVVEDVAGGGKSASLEVHGVPEEAE